MNLCIRILVAIATIQSLSFGSPEEGKIIHKILSNYNKLTRPVARHDAKVTVEVGMTLLQIIQVDEKHQIITINAWLHSHWMDAALTWDPLEHHNITMVRFPANLIWHPDIMLHRTADEQMFQAAQHRGEQNANIMSDGLVIFVPAMIIKSICKMDVTWFPFDSQSCQFQFGSWTYSEREFDLRIVSNISDATDVSEYVANGEWKLVAFTASRIVRKYDCCEDSYPSVFFTIEIKREIMYYWFNLIVPAGLIGFLAVLGFTLPPDSTEKLSLGVTVLFSLIVFINVISESMPSTSDGIPLLGTYFNCVMFAIASSVVSTIVVNVRIRGQYGPEKIGSKTQTFLLRWLPWLLRIDVRRKSSQERIQKINKVEEKDVKNNPHQDTETIKNEAVGEVNADELREQWMLAAVVVERLCFIISICFAFVSTAIMLISAYNKN